MHTFDVAFPSATVRVTDRTVVWMVSSVEGCILDVSNLSLHRFVWQAWNFFPESV